MNGELSQLVTLTTHGNAWLRAGQDVAPLEILQTPQLSQYIASLRFTRDGQELSAGTAGWLRYLRREQASGVQLIVGPPPNPLGVSAFVNANKWAIQATYQGRWEVWNPFWAFDQDRKAWLVTYTARALAEPYPAEARSLEAAAEALKVAAHDAEQVSRKMGTDAFTRLFVATQQALESASPEPEWTRAGWLADRLPTVPHNPLARRLLLAVVQGWVFGGMGSWLDHGPDFGAATGEEFDTVTRQLWDAVVSAVAAAANAYLELAG